MTFPFCSNLHFFLFIFFELLENSNSETIVFMFWTGLYHLVFRTRFLFEFFLHTKYHVIFRERFYSLDTLIYLIFCHIKKTKKKLNIYVLCFVLKFVCFIIEFLIFHVLHLNWVFLHLIRKNNLFLCFFIKSNHN